MTFSLKKNVLANARGFTFKDGGGLVWSINANTNEITVAGTSGSALSSVGLSDSSTTPIYTVGNSPLTSNGTLTLTLNTQSAAMVFAGPTSGGAAQPTFRALVAGDIPALSYVTSVGLSEGSSTPIYTISGSPVSSSGTLTYTLKTQSANTVFAGPTTGAAAQPGFRAWVAADVPSSILPGSFSGFANPSAQVGTSAVNGTATTAARSDSAPAINQGMAPTWSAQHIFTVNAGGSASAILLQAAQPTICWDMTGGGTDGKYWDFGPGSSSNSMELRTVNDAQSTVKLALKFDRTANALTAMAYGNSTDNPTHTFFGKVGVNGNSPPSQVTGWGTPTGAAVVTNFNGASGTLVNCTNAIAKIITDLKAFGLYGA